MKIALLMRMHAPAQFLRFAGSVPSVRWYFGSRCIFKSSPQTNKVRKSHRFGAATRVFYTSSSYTETTTGTRCQGAASILHLVSRFNFFKCRQNFYL